jgi:hypothetical protein
MNICKPFESITPLNHAQLRSAFDDHVDTAIRDINERKADMIQKYSLNLNCLKCFDLKRLFTERKYLPFSTLDFKGIYDVITCDVCGDGSVLYCTETFCEKVGTKKIRYANITVDLGEISQDIYHLALEKEIAIPDWEFMEQETFRQKFSQTNIEGDIKEAVDLIKNMVGAYFANPASLTSFLENIQIKFKHFCCTSKTKKTICRKVDETGVVLLFEIEKESKQRTGGIFNLSYQKQTEGLIIHLLCLKPNNNAAEQICTDLMNKKISGIIDKSLHETKDKAVRRNAIFSSSQSNQSEAFGVESIFQ